MKCAIYIKVSTDRDEQKDSLENQKMFFLNYIAEKNYSLYKIYTDIASGTSIKNRVAFLELIEDVKKHNIDLILTKEISRLRRSVVDTGNFYELCKDNNVNLITFNNGINTLTNETQYISLYCTLAQIESENTSSRIKLALESIAKSGKFKGSIAPYGYFIENKNLKIKNDYTPDIVKRIFKEYCEGKGVDTIARHLTRDNIPTPAQVANKSNAGTFGTGRTVQLILQNRNYTGDLTQCKSYVTSIRTKKRKKENLKILLLLKTLMRLSFQKKILNLFKNF